MVRILRLLLALAAVIVIMDLAVANRTPVEVSLAPLPLAIEVPLYGVLLIGLAFGVLIGGIGVWLGAMHQRRDARRMRNKVWALENQLNVLKEQEEKARHAPAHPAASARAAALPALSG